MSIHGSRFPSLNKTSPVSALHQEKASAQAAWDDLPEDVLRTIFTQAGDGRELTRYSAVNKTWQDSAAEPQLWQALAKGLRLPDAPSGSHRKFVERAYTAGANIRKGRPTKQQTIQHQSRVRAVSLSGDGSKLATGDGYTTRITDVHSGATLTTIQHQSWVRAVSLSGDGSKLATGDGYTTRITDVHSGATLTTIQHKAPVYAMSLSGDGSKLATLAGRKVRITDVHSGATLATIRHKAPVHVMSLSGDGNTLATGSGDGTERVTDVHSGATLTTIQHKAPVYAMSFSGDGSKLATGDGHTTRITDVHSGATLTTIQHQSWVGAVSLSGDGSKLATGSDDHTARIIDYGGRSRSVQSTYPAFSKFLKLCWRGLGQG